MGPLHYLAKNSNDEIQLIYKTMDQGISWVDVMGVDIVFLHRPCQKNDVTLMQIAHDCNVPVWIDYDDWLFELPGWNPHAHVYNNPTLQNNVAHCLATADIVSCTTQALYEKFKLVNPNVVILPNAYRSDLFHYRKEALEPRDNIIYWRGSNTHEGDLLSVREGFKGLGGVTHFIGTSSWMLLSGLDPMKYRVTGALDLLSFNRHIYQIKPKVMAFPLVDCLFNRCKSNIAYLEALHAGAICVAPDLPEWRRVGVVTYKPHDSDSFRDAINQTLELPQEAHESIVNNAFNVMTQIYDISVVNEKRKSVVSSLRRKLNYKNPFDQMVGFNAYTILKGGNSVGETVV
jgi:hypothetical protein